MTADMDSFPDIDSPEDLRNAAEDYAETVDMDVPLTRVEWKISHHAKKHAGHIEVHLLDGKLCNPVTITLTWKAFTKHGWERMKSTIRHELIHLWEYDNFGESSHDERFQEKAKELDCSIHCEEFETPRYAASCGTCGEYMAAFFRRSKLVKSPSNYRCKACDCPSGSGVEVYDREKDVSWTTWEEFKQHNPDHETLTAPYRYVLTCASCDVRVTTRERISALTRHPEKYGCERCDSYGLEVYDCKMGQSWTSNEEYTRLNS